MNAALNRSVHCWQRVKRAVVSWMFGHAVTVMPVGLHLSSATETHVAISCVLHSEYDRANLLPNHGELIISQVEN